MPQFRVFIARIGSHSQRVKCLFDVMGDETLLEWTCSHLHICWTSPGSDVTMVDAHKRHGHGFEHKNNWDLI
jgi:hypothetical protein